MNMSISSNRNSKSGDIYVTEVSDERSGPRNTRIFVKNIVFIGWPKVPRKASDIHGPTQQPTRHLTVINSNPYMPLSIDLKLFHLPIQSQSTVKFRSKRTI